MKSELKVGPEFDLKRTELKKTYRLDTYVAHCLLFLTRRNHESKTSYLLVSLCVIIITTRFYYSITRLNPEYQKALAYFCLHGTWENRHHLIANILLAPFILIGI